ncbi:MAG TPA: aminotransferase class IV [Tepidisphaeraceae bacterium]|nr:aminotransferase class IV [Tepidisphaeraceae bacterium]
MPTVWLNGTFVEEAEASVSVRDTGLLRAAGVFTTMRASGGRVFRLDAHLQRLRASCEALSIPLLPKDEVLRDAVGELLTRNSLADARLRLTVTRGTAEQDPLHGLRLTPTVFCTAAPLEPYPAEYYAKGLTVILLDEQKLNPYDVQAGHKTLNYLSRLAALRSANQRGAGEALWFNVHNYLQSGSISNIFLVKDGVLITPPTNIELGDAAVAQQTPYPRSDVLPGVTRAAVIELARSANIPVKLASITVNQLLEADELFLTNSIMQVMPVCRIERKAIGDDKPGQITRQLMAVLDEEVRRDLRAS